MSRHAPNKGGPNALQCFVVDTGTTLLCEAVCSSVSWSYIWRVPVVTDWRYVDSLPLNMLCSTHLSVNGAQTLICGHCSIKASVRLKWHNSFLSFLFFCPLSFRLTRFIILKSNFWPKTNKNNFTGFQNWRVSFNLSPYDFIIKKVRKHIPSFPQCLGPYHPPGGGSGK